MRRTEKTKDPSILKIEALTEREAERARGRRENETLNTGKPIYKGGRNEGKRMEGRGVD